MRDWLLALLRYAVTLEEADHAALLAAAAELDRSGARSEQPAFDFFTRTSMEFCLALGAPDQPESRAVLQRLLRRIDDRRLRGALEGAIALARPVMPGPPLGRSETRPGRREDLWKGLAPVGGRGGA